MERRNFLKLVGAAAAVASTKAKFAMATDKTMPGKGSANPNGSIPYRTLGHTGEKVSVVGIGGHHLGRALVDEAESIRIVRTALDSGAIFLNNGWDYNGGASGK